MGQALGRGDTERLKLLQQLRILEDTMQRIQGAMVVLQDVMQQEDVLIVE